MAVSLWDFFADEAKRLWKPIQESREKDMLFGPNATQPFQFDPTGLALGIKAVGIPAGKILHHAAPKKWAGNYRGKFDIDKVASGEGGTMHGIGLYTSENPKVTQAYMRSLGGRPKFTKGGDEIHDVTAWLQKDAEKPMLEAGVPRNIASQLSAYIADNARYAIQDPRGNKALPLEEVKGYVDEYLRLRHRWLQKLEQPELQNSNIWQEYMNAPNATDMFDVMNNVRKAVNAEARNIRQVPTDVNHYQFLLRDKYLPGILDLDSPLQGQSPEVLARLQDLNASIYRNAPKSKRFSADYAMSEAEKWRNYKYDRGGLDDPELLKALNAQLVDVPHVLGDNPYWTLQYNPKYNTADLLAKGAHYKGLSRDPRHIKWAGVPMERMRGLLNSVDTSLPANVIDQMPNMSGRELQNYLNNLYAQFQTYNPLMGGDYNKMFKTDPRLRASGVLAEHGIHGNRYLDEGSRGLVDRMTKNYVIWDPQVLDDLPILKIREH